MASSPSSPTVYFSLSLVPSCPDLLPVTARDNTVHTARASCPRGANTWWTLTRVRGWHPTSPSSSPLLTSIPGEQRGVQKGCLVENAESCFFFCFFSLCSHFVNYPINRLVSQGGKSKGCFCAVVPSNPTHKHR